MCLQWTLLTSTNICSSEHVSQKMSANWATEQNSRLITENVSWLDRCTKYWLQTDPLKPAPWSLKSYQETLLRHYCSWVITPLATTARCLAHWWPVCHGGVVTCVSWFVFTLYHEGMSSSCDLYVLSLNVFSSFLLLIHTFLFYWDTIHYLNHKALCHFEQWKLYMKKVIRKNTHMFII